MSLPVPASILTVAYGLHMLATVVLVGGLFVLSVLWMPAISAALNQDDRAAVLRTVTRRFQPLAWLSIAVLTATGLTQMAANPNYVGLLAVENRWSAAMFAKHAAFGVMVLLAAYQTWVIAPALERRALQRPPQGEQADPAAGATLARLLRLNFWIAVVVLGLTAIARTA